MSKTRVLRYGDVVLTVEMNEEYPFLSEESFERKNRRHAHRSLEAIHNLSGIAYYDDLETACALVDECEYLTDRQKHVLKGVLQGKTLTEIASECGVTKQAVSRTYRLAIRKIRLRSQLTPYDQIGEVYQELVQRK